MNEEKSTPIESLTEEQEQQMFAHEIENDREFKAYIYQHLIDLQPFLGPEAQIAVVIQRTEWHSDFDDSDTGNSSHQAATPPISSNDELVNSVRKQNPEEIALSLIATLGEYRIEAEGVDLNIYEAFVIAKRAMLQQLEDIYAEAIDSTERDAQIDAMLNGSQMLH
jgi:hypothetical protein